MFKAKHYVQNILSTLDDLRFAVHTLEMDEVHQTHISKKLTTILSDANGILRLFERPCKYWKQNKCHFGNTCAFRHTQATQSILRAAVVPNVACSPTTSTKSHERDATAVTTISSPLLRTTASQKPGAKGCNPNPTTQSTQLQPFGTIGRIDHKKRPNKRQRAKIRKQREKELARAKLDVAIDATKKQLQPSLDQFFPVAKQQQQPPTFAMEQPYAWVLDPYVAAVKRSSLASIVVDEKGDFCFDTADRRNVRLSLNKLKTEIEKAVKKNCSVLNEKDALAQIKDICTSAKECECDYDQVWQQIEMILWN